MVIGADSSDEMEKTSDDSAAGESSPAQSGTQENSPSAADVLAEKISGTVLKDLAEKNEHIKNIQQISQLQGFLTKEGKDMDSSFKYAQLAHPDQFNTVRDVMSSSVEDLTPEKARDAALYARTLLETEKRMEQAFHKTEEKKEEKPIDNNFMASTMAGISGRNVPAGSKLSSSEISEQEIEENFPSSQAQIEQVIESGQRVANVKNWESAKLDELKGKSHRDASAYLTLTPDRLKIANDISAEAKRDALYKPKIFSKQTFNSLHGLGAPKWDEQSRIEEKERAKKEIVDVIGNDISREFVSESAYTMSK